jgi:ABC-type uncharacterized transport system ATPase subunit
MSSETDQIFLSAITKQFGGVVANDGVDLTLRPGEIHALLGENGAGKSTLMNILSGVYLPDKGDIFIRGEKIRFRSPWDAVRRGIGMVHQHFQLVDAFTVLDNVLLGSGETSLRLNRKNAAKRVESVGHEHGLHVDPNAFVWQLTVGQRQKVEILKLLYRGANLLLLDEPTSMLTPSEADDLYVALRRLAAAGKYVVFITHKLREVVATADRVTVLRRGRVVATKSGTEVSIPELGALMVGAAMPPPRSIAEQRGEEVVLRLQDLRASAHLDASGLKGVSLELRRGEILGIAGVAGNGQVELAECIAGIRRPQRGRIFVKGADVTRWGALRRMRAGVRFVPEDRLGMGLVPAFDVIENVLLRDYREGALTRGGWLNRREARKRAAGIVREYAVHTPGIDTLVQLLSGGNQQKILIGRELLTRPAVLVVAQPARGLDVAAARAVHDKLLDLRESGAGVVLISEDLDEILALSDRIAVLYGGAIKGVWSRSQAERSEIGAAMGGHFLDAA